MGVLRRFLPKGLFARTLLIIVMPMAITQIAIAWSFFEVHWENVTIRLSEGVAGDIGMVTELYERDHDDPAALDRLFENAAQQMELSVVFVPDAALPTSRRSSIFRTLDRTLRRALQNKTDHVFWFDTTRYENYVDVRVESNGGYLRFIVTHDRVYVTTGHIFLAWIIGASVLLTAVSIIFVRNQVKPILLLAEAAEQFGRGQEVANYRPYGATEVRMAATAFMEMRSRLKRHLDQRTVLLAGVSHDLRTPLTRLRLQMAI
jgi:two-component system osmolarity sensor histidine kinase EnvZ